MFSSTISMVRHWPLYTGNNNMFSMHRFPEILSSKTSLGDP